MVLRPTSANYLDILTDAALHIVRDQGMGGLTVRAVADWVGVTPAAVSQRTTRQQMVSGVVELFCERWLTWVSGRTFSEGVFALLPGTNDDVAALRILLGVIEHARHDGDAARRVAAVADAERAILDRFTELEGADARPNANDACRALVDGLRAAVGAPRDPMPVDRARDLLGAHLQIPVPELPRWPSPGWGDPMSY